MKKVERTLIDRVCYYPDLHTHGMCTSCNSLALPKNSSPMAVPQSDMDCRDHDAAAVRPEGKAVVPPERNPTARNARVHKQRVEGWGARGATAFEDVPIL